MREGFGLVLRADGGEGASLAGAGKSRTRYAQRDDRLLEERLPVIVRLTWAKRAGNTYRVSFGCRNADAIAMNTPRRLCGTMPPTHVSHPPTSFLCSCCTETGHICSFFEGEDPRPRTRTLPLPVVLDVKGLPVSLRRRRVLCTLPILQPCALRHALHCYGCVRSGLREAMCLALGTHGTKTNSRKGVRQHRRGCTWRLRS